MSEGYEITSELPGRPVVVVGIVIISHITVIEFNSIIVRGIATPEYNKRRKSRKSGIANPLLPPASPKIVKLSTSSLLIFILVLILIEECRG